MNLNQKVNEMLSVLLKEEFGAEAMIDRDDTPKWDSLKHVELIFLLEDEFDIEIPEEDMPGLSSTEKVCAYLSASGSS